MPTQYRQCSFCFKYRVTDNKSVSYTCADAIVPLIDTRDEIEANTGLAVRELGPEHHPLKVGTVVRARYTVGNFHVATISSVDHDKRQYTLDWKDGDRSRRWKQYELVSHVYIRAMCERNQDDDINGPVSRVQYFDPYFQPYSVFGKTRTRDAAAGVFIPNEPEKDFIERVGADGLAAVLRHACDAEGVKIPIHPLFAGSDDRKRSIAAVLSSCFPPAFRLVVTAGNLKPTLRPFFCSWGKTVTDILLFHGMIMHEQIKWGGQAYRDCSSVSELRDIYNHISNNNFHPIVMGTSAENVLQFMLEILQTEILVDVPRNEHRQAGFVVGRQFARDLWRSKITQMDYSNKTVAFHQALRLPRSQRLRSKKKQAQPQPLHGNAAGVPAYNNPNIVPIPGHRLGNIAEWFLGDLKSCHKGVPNAGPFTGDLTVVVCPCGDGHSKLLAANIMDAGESPRNVKDYLDRLTHCPDYVWYDNSCHLSLMLMSRAPHRYYKLIVMSDNFHVANHTACSVLIAPSQWNHIDRIRNANTEAAEQANAEMVKHLTRSLKFCKPSNALNVLELYMIIMNAKQ